LIRAIVLATVTLITQIEANHINQRNDVTLGMSILTLIEIVKENYPVLWQMDHKEYRRKGLWNAGSCYACAAHLLYNASKW